MNITVQYPIIDNRVFLKRPGKLPKPYFISPNLDGNEYIRYFGAMKGRHFQEYSYCVGENTFCNAPRAFHFRREPSFYRDKPAKLVRTENRFYSDGHVLGKFEVKSTYRFNRGNISADPEQTFIDLLGLHFSHDARINDMKGGAKQVPFLDAGPALANLYMCGSTAYKEVGKTKKYWVQAGQPIIITESYYTDTGTCRVPENAMKINMLESSVKNFMGDYDKQFWLRYYSYGDNDISGWDIVVDGESQAAKGIARNLRTLLLRIHAEKQSIIKALEFLSINKDNSEVDVQKAVAFIKRSLNKLLKEKRFNMNQGPIVEAAFAVDDTFSQKDYSKLRQVLLDINNKYIIDDFDCLFAQIDFDRLCDLFYDQLMEDPDSIPEEIKLPMFDALFGCNKLKLKQLLEKHESIINGCKSSALFEALKWVGSTAFTAIMQ